MKMIKNLLLFLLIVGVLSDCKKPETSETGIIEGIITNSQTSEPVKGATVSIGSVSSKTTGSDGKYRFEGLEAKEYTIQAQSDGFETNTKTIVVISGETKQGDISLNPLVPILGTSSISLDFGMNQNVLPITITNKGKGTLTWSATKDATWLTLNPSSGTTTSESSSLNIQIDRTGLTPKSYTSNVIINSNGGDASIQITMLVQGPTPTAIFTVNPSAGALSQTFSVDASGSLDDVDPISSLFIRWRWDDNESFSSWITLKTSQHQFTSEGLKNITLEVKDSDGHIGTTTKTVLVSNSLQLPYITTSQVISITGTTASCGGNVQSDGGSEISQRGVCWRTTPNPTIFDPKTTDGFGLGQFTSDISGLTLGVTYYVRAYASNAIGTSYGNEISFVAGQNNSSPVVTTANISNLKANTATCGGTVSSEGSSAVSARGVCWGTGTNPTVSDPHSTDGSGTGTFGSAMTGLSATTTYYVRAYATNLTGTSYGNEVSFTTPQEITPPGVTTDDPYSVTENSALTGGNVITDGGDAVVSKGVCWSTNQNPSINDSHTSDGSGLGAFTSNITGLTPSTPYYFRAYATNSAGTGYGNQNSFTTMGTLASVTTVNVTGITENSAIAGGIIISAGGSNVTERGICYSLSENPTIYDKKISNGSGLGSYSSPLTILMPTSTYNVRAYAINQNGTAYGENKTFTTLEAYYAGFESGMPTGWNGNCVISTTNPYEGYYCLKSSNIDDSITFTRTVTTPTGGWVSFITYCQENSFNFYIDDVLQGNLTYWGQWHAYSYPITTGNHTFKWVHAPASWAGSFDVYLDYFICTQ